MQDRVWCVGKARGRDSCDSARESKAICHLTSHAPQSSQSVLAMSWLAGLSGL